MATSPFGKAFREARAAGDTTFMFNGKKYNTKLASDIEQPSVGGKLTPGENKARDLYTRSGRATVDKQDEESAKAASMAAYKPRREPKAMTEVTKPGTSTNYENEDATSETFKRGGKVGSASKRADGIAMRGKTRGTMVMCGGGMARK